MIFKSNNNLKLAFLAISKEYKLHFSDF